MVALLGLLFGILGALFGLLGVMMQAGGFRHIGEAILRIIPGRTAVDDAATREHPASFFLTSASIVLTVVASGILTVSIIALVTADGEPGTVQAPTSTPTPTLILTPTRTPTSTPQPPTPTPTRATIPTATARRNCDQMRGTPYRNPDERPWFLTNCVPPPPPLTPTPPDGPTPIERISLEGEVSAGSGEVKERSDASGARTIWLHADESLTLSFDLIAGARYRLNMRYSNDNANDLPSETVAVAVDGVLLGQFVPQDTGDDGFGWNVFVWSDIVGVVGLSPGHHEVVLSVTGGDGFGVEIDVVALVRVQ